MFFCKKYSIKKTAKFPYKQARTLQHIDHLLLFVPQAPQPQQLALFTRSPRLQAPHLTTQDFIFFLQHTYCIFKFKKFEIRPS